MTRISLKPAAATLALAAAALLAGCGSTKTATVTVTSTQTVAANSTTRSETSTSTTVLPTTTSTSSSSTSTTSTSASATRTTETATTTRTETAPAFVGTTTTPSGALGAAVALLAHKGYQALDTSTYQAGDTLRVLIGRAAGGERAFFFDQGTYLGTDATAPSAQITVLGQNDTEVTLAYATFRAGESAPSGRRSVRFALDMGQLSPLDAIPSVAVRR